MLKLIEITKEYKTEEESVLALHNVSLEFRKNEFVSILGPSGCGKTTMLNIIGGLDRYTSGDIQVDGISTEEFDDVDWDTYRNRRIGFVFQSYNLIPHMTVLKNVQLSLTLAGISKEEGRERALEALRKVGLEKQAKKKPNQMSGGQMQRVAIARALVNNPDIILADEPTGALDSESGVQVMELLKEVAEDRLVIMVTHNGQLAEEYSTRIINLRDGEVVGDTMPYDSAAETAEEPVASVGTGEIAENGDETSVSADESAVSAEPAPPKKKSFFARLGAYLRKSRAKDKSSMSIATAVNLSWTNLLSKKGRTLLTSIAGSIGIIGIVVVLALSNGVNAYIAGLEEDALSQYPITINDRDVAMDTIMNTILGSAGNTGEQYPDSGQIIVGEVLGSLLSQISSVFAENDLKTFKEYIEANFDDELGVVKYGYGTTMNIYTDDPKNPETDYMKVNPFTDAMGDFMDMEFPGMGAISDIASSFTAVWDQLSTSQELLDRQYDVLDGRWPSQDSPNEIVIVLDSYNTLPDFAMFMLGLRSQEDLMNIILPGGGDVKDEFYEPIDISSLIGKEYKVLTDSDYFYADENSESGYSQADRTATEKSVIDPLIEENGALTLEVVGIVRPKPGVTVTSINGYVGYTEALTLALLEKAESHTVVGMVQDAAKLAAARGDAEAAESIVVTEDNFKKFASPIALAEEVEYPGALFGTETIKIDVGTEITSYDIYVEMLRALGVADPDTPQSVSFYPNSFDHKADIERFIATYTEETGNDLKYTDQLAIMMSFVEQLSSTVTQVLVGFAAISLIVSTIMIAIIIYTSVLERRKEIGVLRSLGARKKDISRVFIAESAILGAYSGAIGVLVAAAVSVAGSAILSAVLGISGLMSVSWWQCLVMFGISILLSVIAGFIPSRIAAKKDPTTALRSE